MKELIWTLIGILLTVFLTGFIIRAAPMMAGFILFIALSMVVKFLNRKSVDTGE